MKKVLIIALTLIGFNGLMAQQGAKVAQKDVPVHISKAFSQQYPAAEVKGWESAKQGYMVHFNHEGKRVLAYYSHDGQWQGLESGIKWTKHLPEGVKQGWAKSGHYNWYVKHIRTIQTPTQQLYVLHLDNSSTLDSDHVDAYRENRVLYFSTDGELVRSERI